MMRFGRTEKAQPASPVVSDSARVPSRLPYEPVHAGPRGLRCPGFRGLRGEIYRVTI